MLRRRAISLLLGSASTLISPTIASLDRFLDRGRGCALLPDIGSQQILAASSNHLSGSILLPPGSTPKPFTLSALVAAGKLHPRTSFPWTGRLTLEGHRLDCSHARGLPPMHIDTALA
jgi:hypothetical protein